jgi:hypothetical protein
VIVISLANRVASIAVGVVLLVDDFEDRIWLDPDAR